MKDLKKFILESQEYIKKYGIGASHNCPNCSGLLIINEDLTCSDFGEKLVNCYKEMGVDVSKEEASSIYIDCK